MRPLLLLPLIAVLAAEEPAPTPPAPPTGEPPVAATPAPAPWSGTVLIDEVLISPPASAERRALLATAADHLEARCYAVRRDLATAPPELRKVLTHDLATLRTDLERTRRAGGGEAVLSRRTLFAADAVCRPVARGRALLRMDDLVLLADRDRGQGVVRTPEGRRTLDLAPVTPATAVDGAAADPLFGLATRTATLTVRDEAVQVRWTTEVPNLFALVLPDTVLRDTGLGAALAGLPGLPLTVERTDPEGRLVLRVSRITPGPVADADLTVPP